MKLSTDSIIAPYKADIVTRPWGYYGLYADNVPCTTKILFVRKGESLSLQYHFLRSQFYLLIDGDFTIEYSSIEVPDSLIHEPNEDWRIKGFNKFLEEHLVTVSGNEGDMFGFNKKVIHRATYNGDRKYGRCLDVAFGINDEGDIVRLKDKYGRA